MINRLAMHFTMAMTIALAPLAVPAMMAADPVPVAEEGAHLGTFVSASGMEFTMKDDSGLEHKHKLAPDAKVTDPNGEPCQITDLKGGQKIRVTTKAGDKTVATKVECVV
jgi:hypothetical protein